MSQIDDALPAPRSLEDVLVGLARIASRNHGTKVSVGEIVANLGPRSFAPLVLAVGLLGVSPIDSIPTLPTTFGIIVLLTVGQMLVGRRSLWLPGFISRRAVNADRLSRALTWLEPYARWADRYVGVRLTILTQGPSLMAIAVCCAALALLMPFMEPLPLLSTFPSLAFAAFGTALLLHDGAAALLGFVLSGVILALVIEVARLPF